MKLFITFFGGALFGWYFAHSGNFSADVQVTHNASGEKIVVITAGNARNSTIAAGRECEHGYTVIGQGRENDENILTITCPEKKSLW